MRFGSLKHSKFLFGEPLILFYVVTVFLLLWSLKKMTSVVPMLFKVTIYRGLIRQKELD